MAVPLRGAALAHAGTAVDRLAEVAVVVLITEGEAGAQRSGLCDPNVGVEGLGIHQDAGVEDVVRVEDALDPAEERERSRRIHVRQKLAAGTAVAVFAGEGPAVGGHEPCRVGEEGTEGGGAVVALEREVQAHMDAAVSEVAERESREVVGQEEFVEFPEVIPHPFRRDGRVLPPRVGRCTCRRAAGKPTAVLADPPQRCRLGRVGDNARVRGDADAADRCCPVGDLGGVVTRDFNKQPGRPTGQFGHGLRSLPRAHHLDDPRIQSLTRGGLERQHGGHGVTGVADVREPKHHHGLVRRVGHQPDARFEHHGERTLAAHEHPAQVESAFRQQMLQRVA